ncbi:MAG: SDR family oxidoreductase [Streptosporangiales bacterium]|nr:SDR family oxidoreductase [Streptosporangiales bacterium]
MVSAHERAVDEHADAVAAATGSIDVSFDVVPRGDVQGIPLVEMTTADLTRAIVNGVTSNFITARAAARQMIRQGSGVILALDSGSAKGTTPMMGSTSAADAAIDSLVCGLATELGPHGVRVLGIWAGGIPETLTSERIAAVNASMQLDEAGLRAVIGGLDQMRILPRSPRLAEIADTAAFLASDRAYPITGSFINATAMSL